MFNTVSTATETFLANLSNLERRLLTAQQQVSSGLRLQYVSDDPDQVSSLLEVKAQVARNEQIKYNLAKVTTQINTAEDAINTAGNLLDTARTLAAQGASDTTTTDTRLQLATQVKGLLSQMLTLANTNVGGQYLFSGSTDNVAPYGAELDLAQANGVGAYKGSAEVSQVEHPNGQVFSVSLTADQVFDSGDKTTSVFKSLTSLYNNLMNDDAGAVAGDAANLSTVSSFLSSQQAQYGFMQNQVSDATSFQDKLSLQLQAQMSTIRDADPVEAITTLQKETTMMQAAIQAHAAMPTKSLFDYIG